jgi:uncharacterized membrane protein YcaP (DUF421 family)
MPLWTSILLRSVLLFILVFVLVRLMGKKHPAKTSPFGFVNYAVIAVVTALLALGVIPNLGVGLIVLGVWGLFPILLDYLASRSKLAHDLIRGRETILIKQGKIMEDNVKRLRLTAEELLQELRMKDVFNIADVEFAIMETTGDLNVFLKADKKPVTSHDVEWKVAPQTEPQTVILDSHILNDALTEMGLNTNWLTMQLKIAGVLLENVFVGQVDTNGELYLDLFDDAVQLPQSTVREMLFANLQKIQGELAGFALETKDETAKAMYRQNADRLEIVMDKIRPYLLR